MDQALKISVLILKFLFQVHAVLRDAIDNTDLEEDNLLNSPVLASLGLHSPEKRTAVDSEEDPQIAALASWSSPAEDSRKRKPSRMSLDLEGATAAKRALLRDESEDTSFRRSTLEDDSSEEDEFPESKVKRKYVKMIVS